MSDADKCRCEMNEPVIAKLRSRAAIGIVKYGVTVADSPASTTDWIAHLQEELMDALVYLERLKQDIGSNSETEPGQ